jgi:hypothetical protein
MSSEVKCIAIEDLGDLCQCLFLSLFFRSKWASGFFVVSNWLIAQTDHVRWLLVVPSLSLRMLLVDRLVWILLGKPSQDRESFVIVVLIVHYSFWSRSF